MRARVVSVRAANARVRNAALPKHPGERESENRSAPASKFRSSPKPPLADFGLVRFLTGRSGEGPLGMSSGRNSASGRIGESARIPGSLAAGEAGERCRPQGANFRPAPGAFRREDPRRETGVSKGHRPRVRRARHALATRKALPARRWTAFFPARASAPAPWPPNGFAKDAFA